MATIEQFEKMTTSERQYRYFSEEFKRRKVSEIERNLITVSEVSTAYQVTGSAIYRWIHKYSLMRKRKEKQVVETESDTRKLLLLREQIKELERTIGQKQIKIDFLEKMVELAEEEYRIDIKKKFHSLPSGGSGSTATNTK
jgi:transposase